MKHLTSDLIGPALDWAVAKCEGVECDELHSPIWFEEDGPYAERVCYAPSTDWSQGGPIIEREHFAIDYYPDGGHPDGGEWLVTSPAYETDAGIPLYEGFGPTLLIAAMRCFVASKLGDTVELPGDLT